MNKIIQTLMKYMPKELYELFATCWGNIRIAMGYHQVIKNRIEKTQKNEKMRIVFIVQRTEVFNSVRTIFEAAVANEQCEVYLLPIPRCRPKKSGPEFKTSSAVLDFCRALNGGTIINTYDPETQMYFDLAQINPDYVFLNIPYTETYPEPYEIQNLTKIAKVCYVPYGYQMINKERFRPMYSLTLSLVLLENVDYLFADGSATYTYSRRKMLLGTLLYGNRLYDLGFPRFDNISVGAVRPEPKNILWIPRWTSDHQPAAHNLPSHFFAYKDLLPQYAEERKDGHLTVRPHPLSFQNYINNGLMSAQEVQAYKERIVASKWVSLDEAPSYEEALDQADVLVVDFSSIIIEYFYRGKPIVYCGEREDLSSDISCLTDTFYFVKNWEQLRTVLDDLRAGIDPKKSQRDAAVEAFRKATQNAASNILDVLKNDFIHSK